MKDEFLATLSHELRTPYNPVLGLANILPVGKLQGEELWQGLDAIGQNARNHAQLVDDLLDMSRIMSGKGRLEIQLIDVSAILKESIETLTRNGRGKRCSPAGSDSSLCCSDLRFGLF